MQNHFHLKQSNLAQVQFKFQQIYFKEFSLAYLQIKLVLRIINNSIKHQSALDCRIIVSEFELHSRYYIHFWTNTLGKDVNSLILLAMG